MGLVKREHSRMIKPANYSESSVDHRLYPLTNLDLAARPTYVKPFYAFQSPTPPTNVLEEGLAKALTIFREWPGRFTKDENGRPAIILNDQGVLLIEARTDGILADAMPFDHSPFLTQLVPPTEGATELLLVQLTRFSCGGLVIGLASHHQIADGEAFIFFMNSWGKLVRGEEPLNPLPLRDRSLLVPRDPPQPVFDHIEYKKPPPVLDPQSLSSEFNVDHGIVVKRFHFDPELLKQVKRTASRNAVKPFSTFVSLLAHMWRCVSQARGLKAEVETRVTIAVSGRRRLVPPLPLEYFGNVVLRASAQTTVSQLVLEQPLEFAAALITNAIPKVDNDYIRSAIDFLQVHYKNEASVGRLSPRVFLSPNVNATSWVQLPLYELDFGWGTPVYAGPSLMTIEGRLTFLPSYTRDGSIDVMVCLLEADMPNFEQICYKF